MILSFNLERVAESPEADHGEEAAGNKASQQRVTALRATAPTDSVSIATLALSWDQRPSIRRTAEVQQAHSGTTSKFVSTRPVPTRASTRRA